MVSEDDLERERREVISEVKQIAEPEFSPSLPSAALAARVAAPTPEEKREIRPKTDREIWQ